MFDLIKTKFTKTKFTNKLLLLWDKSKHMFKKNLSCQFLNSKNHATLLEYAEEKPEISSPFSRWESSSQLAGFVSI